MASEMDGNKNSNMISTPSKAYLIIKRAAPRAKDSGAEGLKSIGRLLSGSELSAAQEDQEILRVQYNPSSLTIRANAREVQIKSMQQSIDSSALIQQNRPPSVVLSVTLIFEAINPQDAFMADKFRISAGDTASAIRGGIAAAQKTNTVKNHINGLIGMILNHDTRKVTFLWRDMSFTGCVEEINSDYTMFNMAGNPIRGSVTMNIVQSLSGPEELGVWNNAFDNNFKEESGGKSVMGKMGNLINVNL